MDQPATSGEPEPLSSQEVQSLRALTKLLSSNFLPGKLMTEKVFDKLAESDKVSESLLEKLESLETFFKSQKDFLETPITDHTMLKVKRFVEDTRKSTQQIMFTLLQDRYNSEHLVTKHAIRKFSDDLKAFYRSLQTFLYSGQTVFYYNFDESIIEPNHSIPTDLQTLGSGMQYTLEQSSFIVLLDLDAKSYLSSDNGMPKSANSKAFEDCPLPSSDIEPPSNQISLMPVLTSVIGSSEPKGSSGGPEDPSTVHARGGETISDIDDSDGPGSLEGTFADATIAICWFNAIGSSVEAYLHACNLQQGKNLEKSLGFALAVTSVSTFFASVDISAIQLYFSVPIANALAHKTIGVCWFTSLVLSTCGVLSGLFSAGYAQASLPYSDLPLGMYIFLTFGPVCLTAVSAVSFAIGLCVFAHATSAKVVGDFAITSTSILFFFLYVMMSIFIVKDYAESKSSKKAMISLFWLPLAALLTFVVAVQSLIQTVISFFEIVMQFASSAWLFSKKDKAKVK